MWNIDLSDIIIVNLTYLIESNFFQKAWILEQVCISSAMVLCHCSSSWEVLSQRSKRAIWPRGIGNSCKHIILGVAWGLLHFLLNCRTWHWIRICILLLFNYVAGFNLLCRSLGCCSCCVVVANFSVYLPALGWLVFRC